tara:strand:+ start:4023 stop:9425 length:5403 start_codon:yes stop_codon:yes gene_type:complete
MLEMTGVLGVMLVVLLSALLLTFIPLSTTNAAFNEQINYQGKLADNLGVPVADSSYSMTFRLYTVASGGSHIWTETQTVPVTSGLFSVMLGSSTALTGVDFNQTLYLGVNIAGDGEMTPRKVLGAVPAAFEAQQLAGLATTSFLRADQADSLTATDSNPLLTLTQNGTGDILNLFDGGSEVLTVLDGGNVGIGTTTPSALLTVGDGVMSTVDGTNDLYVTDDLEVDGSIYVAGTSIFDANIQANAFKGFEDGDAVVAGDTNVRLDLDEDNDGSGSFIIRDGANSNVFIINESGQVTTGEWNGTALTNAYVSDTLTVGSGGSVDSTALTDGGTISFDWVDAEVADTLTIGSASTIAGEDVDNFLFGDTAAGSLSASAAEDLTEMAIYKSGFWDVNGASWTPTTGWWWGSTFAHRINNDSYLYGAQIIFENNLTPEMYIRGMSGGATQATGTWQQVWTDASDGSGSGLDADTLDSITSGSFLRSDATDSASGALTFSGGLSVSGNSVAATGLRLTDEGSYKQIQSYASEPLYINPLGNDVVLNRDGGNVGIGTTTPTYQLTATGTIGANGIMFNAGDGDTMFAGRGDRYPSGTPTNVNNADFFITGGNNTNFVLASRGNGGSEGILFGNYNGTTFTETMRIDNQNGRLGIDTSSPATQLHIVADTSNIVMRLEENTGGEYFNVRMSSSGNLTFLTDDGSSRLFVANDQSEVAVNDPSPDANFEVSANGDTGGAAFMVSSNYNNDGDLLTLLQNGRLGIGVTNPNRTLDVVGDMELTGLFYDSTGSAGSVGDVLVRASTGLEWQATSTLGLSTVDFLTRTFTAAEIWTPFIPSGTTTFSTTLDAREMGYGFLELVVDDEIIGTAYPNERTTYTASALSTTTVELVPRNTQVDPTGYLSRQSISLSYFENQPRDIEFNGDGTKMYVVGQTGVDITVFDLSTAYDINTASLSTTTSVSSEEASPTGMAFNDDGTKLFVVGVSGDDVNEYTLSVAYDVTTKSHVDATSVSAQDTAPNDIKFNDDGTKMFILGETTKDVFEYSLSTAYDASTRSYTDNLDISAYASNVYGIEFNEAGTKLFVSGYRNITEFDLGTAYDISTATLVSDYYQQNDYSYLMGIELVENDTKLIMVDWNDEELFMNSLPTAGTISNYAASTTVTSLTQSYGMELVDGGSKLFYINYDTRNLREYSMSTPNDLSTLTFEQEHTIGNPTQANNIIFSNDGLTAIITGFSQAVYEYKLTSPFDFTTATETGNTYNPGGSGQATSRFSRDGTKLISLTWGTSRQLRSATLSRPFDITSAVDDGEVVNVGTPIGGNAYSFDFSPDGMFLVIAESIQSEVVTFRLTAPYDISTVDTTAGFNSFTNYFYNNHSGLPADRVTPSGMTFDETGRYLYLLDQSTDKITQYDMGASIGNLGTSFASITLDPEDTGADLAEYYPTADRNIGAGDIVSFIDNDTFELTYATSGSSYALAGVISTNPGITLADGTEGGRKAPLALTGRVPVKVSNENGIVMPGDRITPSSVPGVGMKAGLFDESVGVAITGMDIENLDPDRPMQQIILFVDLQEGVNVTSLTETLFAGASTTFMMEISSSFSTTTGTTTTEIAITETIAETIWDRLANLASRFVDGVLTIVGLRTEEICLTDSDGETCIDRSALNVLLSGEATETDEVNDTYISTTTPQTSTTTEEVSNSDSDSEQSNTSTEDNPDISADISTTTTQTTATSTNSSTQDEQSQEGSDIATSTENVSQETESEPGQDQSASSTEPVSEDVSPSEDPAPAEEPATEEATESTENGSTESPAEDTPAE